MRRRPARRATRAGAFAAPWTYAVCVVARRDHRRAAAVRGARRVPHHRPDRRGHRSPGRTRGSWATTPAIVTSGAFWRQIGNSAIIAAIATARRRQRSARWPPSRSSRYEFRGREALYTLFTLGPAVPARPSPSLPLYLELRQLGLLDSPLGVALPEAAFSLPSRSSSCGRSCARSPRELEDAAAIDGCSRLGFFWRILLPLSRPALMTVAILAVVTSWNAFLLPLLVLNDPNDWTLPLGVATFQSRVRAGHGGDPRLHRAVDGAGAASSSCPPNGGSSAASRARSRADSAGASAGRS